MRDPYWDIVKGLGIIAVVTAHAELLAMEINWFHLELFFFVSGFLLNAEKCMDYQTFFLHKLNTLWKPFVFYNIIFFVLHDFFICINWIATENFNGIIMLSQWIKLYDLPKHIAASIFKGNTDIMCGPTWFMAPFLSNILLFGFLVKVAYKKSVYYLPLSIILLFIVGTAIVKHSPGMKMYIDMAMMLLPITAAGFYLKEFSKKKKLHVTEIFPKRTYIGILIISLAVLGFLEYKQTVLYLSGYGMGNWFTFLVAAFSGIFMTLFVAKFALYIDLVKKVLAFIGKESFHIMALHFVGFKVLTTLYVIFLGLDFHLMAYYHLTQVPSYIYIIFGIGIPLLLRKAYNLIKRRLI